MQCSPLLWEETKPRSNGALQWEQELGCWSVACDLPPAEDAEKRDVAAAKVVQIWPHVSKSLGGLQECILIREPAPMTCPSCGATNNQARVENSLQKSPECRGGQQGLPSQATLPSAVIRSVPQPASNSTTPARADPRARRLSKSFRIRTFLSCKNAAVPCVSRSLDEMRRSIAADVVLWMNG